MENLRAVFDGLLRLYTDSRAIPVENYCMSNHGTNWNQIYGSYDVSGLTTVELHSFEERT